MRVSEYFNNDHYTPPKGFFSKWVSWMTDESIDSLVEEGEALKAAGWNEATHQREMVFEDAMEALYKAQTVRLLC